MSDDQLPKRIRLDTDEVNSLSREDLVERFRDQECYIRYLEKSRSRTTEGADDEDGHGPEEKLKQQNMESARRENTLVLRLTNKEQELQDCVNQISEMKQTQTQSTTQLRKMLLDPALNLVFQRMAKEVDESKEKLKQTQNELSAWKFTSDSQTGKRLMAKCRMLLQENEELGKMIASGRTAKLEGEIALQKTLVQEMKKNQEELDEFVSELEEDVEGMQSMIYLLQTQLKDTKDQLTKLQTENEQLRTVSDVQQQTLPDPSPSNGGMHVPNHSVSPLLDSQTSSIERQDDTDCSKVRTPSPALGMDLSNHSHPESSQRDEEVMDTDSSAQVNSSVNMDSQPGCDSGETSLPTSDRTTQLNNHDVQSHILSADSTSCQDQTEATSSEAWSPQNLKTEDNGAAEDEVSPPEKTVHLESDDPSLPMEVKPLRNGVEQVTQLESEEEL